MNTHSKQWAAERGSVACLFSFPFPVYVNTASPVSTTEERTERTTLRVYPLFRSAPANYIAAPSINASEIPRSEGMPVACTPAQHLRSLASIQVLAGEPDCSALVTMAEEWEQELLYFPMDSLRVDVLGASAQYPVIASTLVKRLLDHLRVATCQWWIGRGLPAVQGYYLRHVLRLSLGPACLPVRLSRTALSKHSAVTKNPSMLRCGARPLPERWRAKTLPITTRC